MKFSKKEGIGIKRFAVLILSAVILFTAIVPTLPKVSADFENTYVNTGNQIEDLIGVAMTQVGYIEGENNDTKYGDWMGYPNQAWCAMFITWCAEQAEIPPSVMDPSAWAHPRYGQGFGIPYYHGTEYTPKRGDLFFKEDFSHVGIVYGVEGEDALTIEANTNDDGSAEGYTVLLRKRKIAECYFGLPQYTHCGDDHTYTIKSEPGHPHRRYYFCSTCKKAFYTGGHELKLSCYSCMDCSCSSSAGGYYIVKPSDKRTRVYSSHRANYVCGYLDPGELVYVIAKDAKWGHILYAGSPGFVYIPNLERFVHAPTAFAADRSLYYDTDSVQLTWEASVSAKDYILTVIKDGETLSSRSIGNVTSFLLEDLTAGDYQVQLQGSDQVVLSETLSCDFTVLPTYSVTYDAVDGTNAPQAQCKYHRQALTLSSQTPSRDGYVFLGWHTEPNTGIAAYQPGDLFRHNQETTLFAVWQREDAKAASLQILTPATQTLLAAGQDPDTAGLRLLLSYDDGTAKAVSDGYEVQSPDPSVTGAAQVTITCEGVQVSYDVLVLPCSVLGDERERLSDLQRILLS